MTDRSGQATNEDHSRRSDLVGERSLQHDAGTQANVDRQEGRQTAVRFDYFQAVVPTPRRNLLQRALNRFGCRLGILPFPVAFDSVVDRARDRQSVFAEIYEKNIWGSPESRSGPGSELKRTAHYRRELLGLLRRRNIRSMFDAPCGDLNWMALVLDEWPIDYEGGDISEGALEAARKRRPDVRVRMFDICSDKFPSVQLWHCRDSLFHLSFEEIWSTFRNFASSDVEYALITTNRARMLKNLDIRTGGHRYLDLERAPFNLPRALEYLQDRGDDPFPRSVGLWPARAIASALQHATSSQPRGG